MDLTIVIGYTRADPDRGYHPLRDGYRPGAAQDTVRVDLPPSTMQPHLVPDLCHDDTARAVAATSPEQWAEAMFVATNAPPEVIARLVRHLVPVRLAAAALQALPPPVRAAMRPLSVGDTVTVAGHTLACASVGWAAVEPDPTA